jgi:hypothetical protein
MKLNFHNLLRRTPAAGFVFDRPLVVMQSDDWGRVGVCDKQGYEQLRGEGILLGQHPYDFYTLETAEDVSALRGLLKRHHDSTGRSPCMVMNFVAANLDFTKSLADGAGKVHLLPVYKGLPEGWNRPGLMEAYRQGVGADVFYPALHGLSHFCRIAVDAALVRGGEHAELIKKFWKAKTPYVYWRMPWVGYEYLNPQTSEFLDPEEQRTLIRQAAEVFARLFSHFPHSACAPGYRANADTHKAWAGLGIRVAQNGSGTPLPPHIDEWELLHLYRTIDFEPAQRDLSVEKYLELANNCFSHGLPVVISVHAINFHSSLRNFREPTIQALDHLLTALEAKYPDLLYVHDEDIHKLVSSGKFESTHGTVRVNVTRSAAATAGVR